MLFFSLDDTTAGDVDLGSFDEHDEFHLAIPPIQRSYATDASYITQFLAWDIEGDEFVLA